MAALAVMGVLLRSQTASFSQQTLPHDIAGLSLTDTMTGQQAMKEVSKLHGLNITIQDAWIGHYGGQKAIVWISQSPGDNDADYLLNAMVVKISQGNEYFKDFEERNMEGQKVYTVAASDGQRHFFYRSGNRVIWIAAPLGQETAFIEEALRLL